MTEPLLHELGAWSARAAGLLAGSIWKGLVLVACVALALRCIPRLSAAVRSAVWTAVLLAVVLLPAFSFHGSSAPMSGHPVVRASEAWSLWIAVVWAALSVLRLAQLAGSALRLRTITRRAVPVNVAASVPALLGQSARRVQICVSPDVSRPSVAGFFRPRILLPVGLLEELPAPELQHVLLHEMEHLRRGDDWTNLLQKLSLALFPLHPALLWLDRRLCVERELACDDGVLRVTRARKAYAACLARLAEDSMMRRGLSLALGLLGVTARRVGQSELSGRVHRILRSPAATMGRVQGAAVSAVVLAGVVAGSVLLARSPQLISFGGAPQPSGAAEVLAQAAGGPTSTISLRTVAARTAKATMVRAVMPQPAKTVQPATMSRTGMRLNRVIARMPRKTQALRRVALAMPQQPTASPYVVFTEWHSTNSATSMRLAVAEYARYTTSVSQQVSTTYAAVPVQGGWLLIQL